jgi:hypothetical protein
VEITGKVSAGISDLLGTLMFPPHRGLFVHLVLHLCLTSYCPPPCTYTTTSPSLHSLSPIQTRAVLKSTGSAFEGFIRDEYTTLVEVSDRIFSTSVDLTYTFSPLSIPLPRDPALLDFNVPKYLVFDRQGGVVGEGKGGVWDALGVAERARTATLDVFAMDESASVQVRGVG